MGLVELPTCRVLLDHSLGLPGRCDVLANLGVQVDRQPLTFAWVERRHRAASRLLWPLPEGFAVASGPSPGARSTPGMYSSSGGGLWSSSSGSTARCCGCSSGFTLALASSTSASGRECPRRGIDTT